MRKQYRTIQRGIENLIHTEMAKHTESRFPLSGVKFPEPLCPLVNPLCPEDLCWLPAGHIGTEEDYHVLGSTNYSYPDRLRDAMFEHMPVGTNREALIEEGYRRAKLMFPEEGEGA